MSESTEANAEEDAIIVALSDYFDGTLPPDKKKEVEAKIENDPAWKAIHDEMIGTQESTKQISGLMKSRVPALDQKFDSDVTNTIHKRSGGRFFARKTLGDRVPVGVLLAIALLVIVTVAYVLWTSQTGSLKVHKDPAPKPPAPTVIEKP
ncbi:MAG TPA: hypothetical protein VGM90_32855 [Kofleriaceae bacterium]|jgi:anti-sigma factor RsiW